MLIGQLVWAPRYSGYWKYLSHPEVSHALILLRFSNTDEVESQLLVTLARLRFSVARRFDASNQRVNMRCPLTRRLHPSVVQLRIAQCTIMQYR